MHGQKIKDEYLRLELAVWPFVYRYRFIQIYIQGNRRLASDLLPEWKIFVNLRYCTG